MSVLDFFWTWATNQFLFCPAADAFGAQPIDSLKIRMPLDQAIERGIGDPRGIEPRSLRAWAIGAAAAQTVEPVADFDQKYADFSAGEFALQSVAGRNVTAAAGAVKEALAGFESGHIAA